MSKVLLDIILVHGTFAVDAAWCKEGSFFRNALEGYLRLDVRYHIFRWSGANSHAERKKASNDLADFVNDLITDGSKNIFLVAHSHGGNIACYSDHKTNLFKKLKGIVFLGTPFFSIEEKFYGEKQITWVGRGLATIPHLLPLFLIAIIGILNSHVDMHLGTAILTAIAILGICALAFFFIVGLIASFADRAHQNSKYYCRNKFLEKSYFCATSDFDEAFIHLRLWLRIMNALATTLRFMIASPYGLAILYTIGLFLAYTVVPVFVPGTMSLLPAMFLAVWATIILFPVFVLVCFCVWLTLGVLTRNRFLFGNDNFADLAFQRFILDKFPNGGVPVFLFTQEIKNPIYGLNHSGYYANDKLILVVARFIRSKISRSQ